MTQQTSDKLALFRRYFTGLRHVYGSYDPRTGRAFQVKEPVTEAVLLAHLQGKRPYGVYLLDGSRTCAVVVDFDDGEAASPLEFGGAAQTLGVPAYIERSKSKGYHVWVFFAGKGVEGSKARLLANGLLSRIGKTGTEVFPKRDRLAPGVEYGNFINAPLFGALVPQGKTVFVQPEERLEPFPDQWAFLESVQPMDEAALNGALARLGGDAAPPPAPVPAARSMPQLPRGRASGRSSLPICAQRMLNDGVTDNQRVSCFRLAIHFNRLGIPFEIAVAGLRQWAGKNRPTAPKRTITDAEIERQADCAYKGAYRGYGCQEAAVRPFCSPECVLFPYVSQCQPRSQAPR